MVHFIGKSKENREWFDEMLKKYGIHITFVELKKKLGEKK